MIDKELARIRLEKSRIYRGECWIWADSCDPKGYGQVRIKDSIYRVHRLSFYAYRNFDIDSDLQVLHKCDVRPCFNPDHLFLGTQFDNMHDKMKKGHTNSAKTHCERGHEYTVQNTRIGSGQRFCKACNRLRSREFEARKKLKCPC